MIIFGVPSFVVEMDRNLILAFEKLCEQHYSQDVKELCSVARGRDWSSTNGPITIARHAIEVEFVDGKTSTVTLHLTQRNVDVMMKAMEMIVYVESAALRACLLAFQNECKRALDALPTATAGWKFDVGVG